MIYLTRWQKRLLLSLLFLTSLVFTFSLGWFGQDLLSRPTFFSPFVTKNKQEQRRPLQKYSFPVLAQRDYLPSEIVLEQIIEETAAYTSYLFSYQTTDRSMTGQLNIPQQITNPKAIVMLRGYYPLESYFTGGGTNRAAAVYAEAGYITIAPDFLGYGDSDPEPTDSWEARFIKPVQVVELITTLEETGIPIPQNNNQQPLPTPIPQTNIALWGHSNGGQIALSVLEIMQYPYPTTLWAPVTTPFPYSILYYGDEQADEGKAQRKWLSIFEDQYDVFDFSITKHLDKLSGNLQLHQGTNDDAVLKWWSDEFIDKIETENQRRSTLTASESAQLTTQLKEPITVDYFTYPGADHNLQPGWNTVVQRDLTFFNQQLGQQ